MPNQILDRYAYNAELKTSFWHARRVEDAVRANQELTRRCHSGLVVVSQRDLREFALIHMVLLGAETGIHDILAPGWRWRMAAETSVEEFMDI